MATAANSDKEKKFISLLDCPICLEGFTNPRQLPCLHTFCKICLEVYVESSVKDLGTKKSFLCPVCRSSISLPVKNMNETTPIASSVSNAEVSSEKYCDPCKRIQENVLAVFWCENCSELLCQDCVKSFHKRLKNSEQHKLKSVKAASNTPDLPLFKHDESCIEHKGKMYEVYCKDHLQMCCVVCLAKNHRTCENILTLDEVVESVSSKKCGPKILKNLSFLSKEVQKLITNKKRQMERLKNRKELLINQTGITIDSAITKLQKMKIELKDGLSRACSIETKPFEMQNENIDWFHGNILQNIRYLTSVSEHGNSRHVFFTIQKIKNCLQVQREHFLKTADDLDTVSLDVSFDNSLDTFIRNTAKPFDITLKHSKGWSDNAKTNVLKELAKLDEYITNMINPQAEDRKPDEIPATEFSEEFTPISEQSGSDPSENEDNDDNSAQDSDNSYRPVSHYKSDKQKKKDKKDKRRRRHHKQT